MCESQSCETKRRKEGSLNGASKSYSRLKSINVRNSNCGFFKDMKKTTKIKFCLQYLKECGRNELNIKKDKPPVYKLYLVPAYHCPTLQLF